VPYTLLLADDSATIQRVIELTFADEDVTVVAVSDGDQAIAHLVAAPPDIVLADVGMPGKNGYDVAQYIQRSPTLCHIPVVLLTGAFEPVDQARADEAGCDGVLAKPFEPQQVIGRVKELLARRRRGFGDVAPALDVASIDNREFPPPFLAPRPTPAAPSSESIWVWPLSDDPASAPVVDPPAGAEATESVPLLERTPYVDRFDAAFSMQSSNRTQQVEPPVETYSDPVLPAADADVDAVEPWDELAATWGDSPSAEDLPLSYAPPLPEPSFEPPEPSVQLAPPEIEAAANAEPIAAPDERLAPIEESLPIELEEVPVATAAAPQASQAPEPPMPGRAPLPALADAFAALLAAEQGEPLAARSGLWPSALAPSAEVREELVEEVVRRVLDRLSDTVVREAVADVASRVAERLILEEIERIKASIK
jgi:CheY-like chemotaxis protein